MARVRRHADLGTREARRRLRVRAEPYWLVIERGLSLGYRKSAEGGAWIVRRYDAGRRRHMEGRLGTADDFRDADGSDVLDFGQAQRKLLAEVHKDALHASGQLHTVADAVSGYVDYLRTHGKSADDAESKLKAYVIPRLGQKRVSELTDADMDAWLASALKRRSKSKKANSDDAAATRQTPAQATSDDSAERQRRRKATINRVINAFKACLKRADAPEKALKRLKKFRSADSARLRWLTVEEASRLQNASGAEFRPLVSAALQTGCRAGELLALRAGDFDSRSKTLLIADSKSGKPRRVPLTDGGVTLFAGLAAGRGEGETLFKRADGSRWYRMAFVRAMRAACEGGKIAPAATFHTLRHTYASHLVQAGVPLMFVASALGHSDTRMVEKHYGHLAPSQVADVIRKNLPRFEAGAAEVNVADIRRAKSRAG